jgi:hypothetical protein
MTIEVQEWTARGWAVGLPRAPAVYAMYGSGRRVAYVGMAGQLHSRLSQHFVRRDSSVVTPATPVRLDTDHIRHVEWWEHASFADRDLLHAAELVAFDVLDPVLRSRGNPTAAAMAVYQDEKFRAEWERAFTSAPTGRLVRTRLQDLARQVLRLEERVSALEEPALYADGTPVRVGDVVQWRGEKWEVQNLWIDRATSTNVTLYRGYDSLVFEGREPISARANARELTR